MILCISQTFLLIADLYASPCAMAQMILPVPRTVHSVTDEALDEGGR